MRTFTQPTRRWQPAAPGGGGWVSAAAMLPAGYAVTWVVVDRRPGISTVGVAAIAIALAVVHKVVPSLVELAAGAGGLVASLFVATERPGCGEALVGASNGVVFAFGSVMAVSAFVALLGTGNGREGARHLLAATGALSLCLLTASPLARGVVSPDDELTRTIVLAGALLTTTVIALRSRVGFPLLGAGLVLAQGAQALSGDPCALSPALSLVGMAAFALGGAALADHGRRRPDPLVEPSGWDVDPDVDPDRAGHGT